MPELKGSLTGVALRSVVDGIAEHRQTGTLQLTKAGATSCLAFAEGRLVAANCGEEHGLQAVAHSALDFSDADFRFVESAPTLEPTLDLGRADLARLLARVDRGSFSLHTAQDEPSQADTACAFLGFADDGTHHYSRSTAMHRCYASGAPSLVSAQDQREVCLSGRFAACPRFRNTGSVVAAAEPTEEQEEALEPAPLESAAPQGVAARPTQREMPPRVAARLATASQMHLGAGPASSPSDSRPAPSPASRERWPVYRRARLRLTAAAAALALLLLGGLLARQAPRVGQPADSAPPVAAATALAAASPLTVAARPATAALTEAARPTDVPAPGGALVDVRFASGPAPKWPTNPPYAAWGDGAYRLLAKDATRFVAVAVPLDQPVSDVIVSATFRKTGGPPGGGYGLIVRDQGPAPRDGENQLLNAYVLEAGDLGEYGVWRRDGDHWVDLVPWTRSSAVRSGGSPNDLLVRAVGDQLTFSVNGSVIAAVTDDTYARGGVGLFVGGDYNDVALDRFDVQLPD